MQAPHVITRTFGTSDANMLEDARVSHEFFVEDKADFLLFDPTLADPFADDFIAAIDAAEALPADDQTIDQQAQKTVSVGDAMKKGRFGYQVLKYFIERAFPDNISVWNEFGYNDYDHDRNSQSQFIQFLLRLHQTAVNYKIELNAVGYDNARIAEIQTWATDLQNANLTQEVFIGNRPVSTQKRIEALNNIWATVRRIRRAGKLIYIDNFAKQQRYLGKSTSPANPPIIGTVAPSSVANILSGGFTAETAFSLLNTGDTQLRFALGQNANEVPATSGITLNPGAEQNLTAAMLGDYDALHTFINVLNLSGEAIGSYELNRLE